RLHDRRFPGGGAGPLEHLAEIADRVVATRPVSLVDHEEVGDLEEPGLVRLHRVTPSGVENDDGRVGGAGDLDLDLAHTDGPDDPPRLACSVDHPHRLGGSNRETTEMPAGGHRADEHTGVGGVVLHAYPARKSV